MKEEIKRALKNKFFICLCIYGIVMIILHCYQSVSAYIENTEGLINYNTSSNIQSNPYAPITNAFTVWIGCDSNNKFAKLFYTLTPLMAVIPYSWSYCSDIKSGQAERIVRACSESLQPPLNML